MIKIHNFNEAHQHFQQHKISFRLLQDQAFILLGICQHQLSTITNPLEITEPDIAWLMQQPEATQSYSDYLGGDIHVCETAQDLLQILGCDFDWAEQHHGLWPNVTDLPIAWDVCNYLEEVSGDPEWVVFVMCWNNAGGPVYYLPKYLWQQARVAEHIVTTNKIATP